MKAKWISGILVVFLLLGLGVTWAMGYFQGQDPEVAKMVEEAKVAFEEGAEPGSNQREEFRKRMEGFTPDQRQQAMKAMRPFFMQMMRQRMQALFEGTPEEQQERISEFADMIVERRNERRQREAERAASGEVTGSGGPPGPGGPGWRNMSEEQRDQRIKGMLDRVPPEDRAVFMQAISKVNEELKSRGEDPVFR